ncbi:hypothetical protein PACTADRAFT_44793 [Pachysolen tannophilus NRRL Y-2460]|uniref:Lysophospholipase NTE1 n=1 Tax=Pachysolen tannophilus NRRL Y-2460 TaxID=669874 RepID=A0A1E4TRV6_PACTA|nr:hypothetical protein PACTADRAFT_44793 [Pachysolen tannophilus NRRL Y-2460]
MVIAGIVFTFVRYRYLTVYSRLPAEPQRQAPKLDVFLESRDAGNKSSRFPNFLDEFLSAIKIFGYLEKNVFHELTKNMSTQKLEAGELFSLDDSKGFSIVVEGNVPVYSKVIGSDDKPDDDDFDNSQLLDSENFYLDGAKYQLLTVIKSGNTLSSMVSLLKLFLGDNGEPINEKQSTQELSPKKLFENSKDQLIPPDVTLPNYQGHSSHSSLNNFKLDDRTPPFTSTSTDDDNQAERKQENLTDQNEQEKISTPVLPPQLVARAKSDSTIAIIPAEAFRRLVEKYPRSASHIVQMILTRLYRVTFQTANNYLGLTKEIFQTEINLNNQARYELPSYLHDGVIQRVNEYMAQNNISSLSVATPTTSASLNHQENANSKKGLSRHVVLESRNSSNPGDLLSNVPLSRKEISYQSVNNVDTAHNEVANRTFSADEETEDGSLRIALIESIFKILGISRESTSSFSSRASTSFSEISSPFLGEINNTSYTNLNNLYYKRRSLSLNSNPKLHSSFNAALRNTAGTNLTTSEDDMASTTNKSSLKAKPLDFENLVKELANKLQIMFIKKDTTIIEENQRTSGLYYVVDGLLDVTHKSQISNGKIVKKQLYTIKPGGVAGYLGSVVGYRSFVTVKAHTNSYVGFIPKEVLDNFMDKYYVVQLLVARNILPLLDKEILLIDFALEWVQSQAGDILYKQGDPANGIYIVLNGRFRSLLESSPDSGDDINNSNDRRQSSSSLSEEKENCITVLSENGQGESLGEVEVLTASLRPSTMVAVRDSETARIPRTLFEILAMSKPSIMIKVSRIVAERMQQINESSDSNNSSYKNPTISALPSTYNSGNYKGSTDYRTITILPVTHGVPVAEFASKLVLAFKACGRSVISLNQASTLNHLGKHAFDKMAKLKQSGFFAELEEKYQTVVYVTDTPVSSTWTHTAISQGDCILLVADATLSPDIGDYERLLVKMRTTARTELILLHPTRYVEPGSTNKWLKSRIWVHSHHHVQMDVRKNIISKVAAESNNVLPLTLRSSKMIQSSQTKIANIKSRVGNIIKDDLLKILPDFQHLYSQQKYYQPIQSHKSDFLRLARILSGNAVGLVLGGGGSRGLSHIGIIKALEDHGIPVDMIGGTSMGSFVGGLYAKDYDLLPIYGRTKRFAGRVSSVWRALSDLTYPVTSYVTGHEFNRGIWKAFGDSRIEDFWLKFYANSTNITNSVMEIHSSGYAWRYVRASMTLAGILPPLTDNGSMLLDGGYIDNLPVEEMKNRGASIIFAVDVGSVDDRSPMTYGDSLSGAWVLFNRWNPFSNHANVPSMAEIQMRLAYVSSVNALEKAKRTRGVIYLRPPIENYATLDFGKFEEIYRVGASFGNSIFKEFEDNGTMPEVKGANKKHKERHKRINQRRNSI